MPATSETVEQIVNQAEQLPPRDRLRVIQRITESLLSSPASSTREARATAFEAEVANFERLKPQLLQQYPGRFVAMFQGEVIAAGDDRMAVVAEAEQAVGNVAFYVGEVTEAPLRRVRMPSSRIVR